MTIRCSLTFNFCVTWIWIMIAKWEFAAWYLCL